MNRLESKATATVTAFTDSSKFPDLIIPTKLANPEAREIAEITAPFNKYPHFIYGLVFSGGAQTPK